MVTHMQLAGLISLCSYRVVEYSPKKAIAKKAMNTDRLRFTLIVAFIHTVTTSGGTPDSVRQRELELALLLLFVL